MGHVFDVHKEYSENMGRGNVVEHDSATGMNFGASDPRGDGAAVPEMPRLK
jgi:gamma-glutamyltranspeptidase/glutathione hydrolase